MRHLIVAVLIVVVPAAASAQTQQLVEPVAAEEDLRSGFPRVRFGADAFVAVGAGAEVSLTAQVHLRVGAQLDEHWALYYQAGGYLGGGIELRILAFDRRYDTFLGMHTSSAMAEVTVDDFQFAIGPSLAVGAIGRPSGMTTEVGGGGSLRAAFLFGAHREDNPRNPFSLGVQADLDYLGSGNYFGMAGLTFGFELM